MFDYSRQGVPSRLAYEGELLVTHRLPTGLIGLVSPFDMEAALARTEDAAPRRHRWLSTVARRLRRKSAKRPLVLVCVPPGARLRMTHIPVDLRNSWGLRTVEDVWFTAVGEDLEHYRDAIRFSNGMVRSLQSIPERVCFVVLSLGAEDSPTTVRVARWPDNRTFVPSLQTS